MTDKQQNYQPLTVKNPFTGELIDVYPFFNLLNEIENNRAEISIEVANEKLRTIIEIMSIYLPEYFFDSNVEKFKDSMSFLFRLSDFFRTITVYRKGGSNA